MARIRYLKPSFTADIDTASISVEARYLYVNLWCHMDRGGVCEGDPRVIKKNIFPYDDDKIAARILELTNELVKEGFLFPVEHEGKTYYYCPTLPKHQKFHKKETIQFEIPNDLLQAAVKKGSGRVPKGGKTASCRPTGRMGNGQRATGNGEQRSGAGHLLADELDFEKLWKAYPRRVGKSEAKKRFREVIKAEADFHALLLAAGKYRRYCEKHRIREAGIKHLTTFLENRDSKPYVQPWRDWIESETGPPTETQASLSELLTAVEA